jgi:hypothetical protein
MSDAKIMADVNAEYYRLDRNRDLVLKLFGAHFRSHQHSGKPFEELPEFFLVRPEVLAGKDLATRPSDKLIIDDSIQRAIARNGTVGVIRHYNPKLNYYWLELAVMPFMLGDVATEDNQDFLFFILNHFVGYARQNPKMYGDLEAELNADKDLALMFREIGKLGEKLRPLMEHYSEEQLVSFNRNWPLADVQKLLAALKDNDQSWCEVFFETIIYMMGRKAKP